MFENQVRCSKVSQVINLPRSGDVGKINYFTRKCQTDYDHTLYPPWCNVRQQSHCVERHGGNNAFVCLTALLFSSEE